MIVHIVFAVVVCFSFSVLKAQDIATSFRYPLNTTVSPRQDFGPWNDGFQGHHLGEDIVVDSELPVYAPGNGVIKFAQSVSRFGYVLIIEHQLPNDQYVCSVLGHLRAKGLHALGTVSKGDLVGHLSSDFDENGGYRFTHLHFGFRLERYDNSSIHRHSYNSSTKEWIWTCGWKYLGYTKNAQYSCSETKTSYDITHSQMLSQWADPSDFIEKNGQESLVGKFEQPFNESIYISLAFQRAYNSFQLSDGSNKLGFPHPQNPYVFEWGTIPSHVQIFEQPDPTRSRFQDGFTWMMYNPEHRRCYVITMTFYKTYVGVTGDILYGLPLNNEGIDTTIGNLIGQSGQPFIRQDFSLNKTMLLGGNPTVVSIIDTPPGTVRIAGGTQPLTLQGHALTKTQVYLTWDGGIELQSNDIYVIKQNGSEVMRTTLREATLTNLTPSSRLTYSVMLVNGVYGIFEQSQEIIITLPQDNRFELLPEVSDSNYMYLTIINERFPDAYAIVIYRNNQEIGRTQNQTFTEFSDFNLAYSATYIYRAAAITASSIMLGWTEEVTVTTGSPPSSPPSPPTLPPTPQNPAAPFAVLRFNFFEPSPYVVNGLATADLVVQNIGEQPVIVGRFYAEGFFTYLPTGEIYSKNWRAIEFPHGLAMNPGDTYHYQMRNDGWAFPGIPTKGILKAYVRVLGIANQWEITQGIGGQSPYFEFDVVNQPQPPLLPNLIPEIESITQSPTSDDDVALNIRVDNRALSGSYPYRVDVLIDGIVEYSILFPEHIAGTARTLTADLGRLSTGTYEIEVIADSQNEIQEIREDDNTAQTQIIVMQALRSNLTVSLGVEDKPHFIDESIPIMVTVANTGGVKSPPCQIGLGNSPFNKEKPGYGYFIPERLIMPEILPGKTLVLQVYFISEVADNFTLWADIDQLDEARESDESDNFTSLDIAVLSPPLVKTVALSPVEDTTITRDWNNAAGIHEDPHAQTLDVYTRQGINRYGRALLRFDFSKLPDFSLIESAEVKLFQLNQGEYMDNQFYLNMLTQSFDSSFVTWTKRTSQYNWTSAGGKYSSSYQTGLLIPSAYVSTWHRQTGAVNMWRTWDATAFVQAVANGAITYRGCIVRQNDIANSRENQAVTFASQDYSDTLLRPQLIIKYRLGPEVVFKDNFESGIDARWYVNRTATGSVPVARLDATPVSVGVPMNFGDQALYLGDSTSGTYARATMELDLDLSKYSEATLDFDWATYSLYGYECIRLDIFDGSWHYDVALYNTQAWQHKSIDLAPYNRAQFLTIRFRSWMDYPEGSDAAYLDNVTVKAR